MGGVRPLRPVCPGTAAVTYPLSLVVWKHDSFFHTAGSVLVVSNHLSIKARITVRSDRHNSLFPPPPTKRLLLLGPTGWPARLVQPVQIRLHSTRWPPPAASCWGRPGLSSSKARYFGMALTELSRRTMHDGSVRQGRLPAGDRPPAANDPHCRAPDPAMPRGQAPFPTCVRAGVPQAPPLHPHHVGGPLARSTPKGPCRSLPTVPGGSRNGAWDPMDPAGLCLETARRGRGPTRSAAAACVPPYCHTPCRGGF